jgi:C4-dicarboxylate-specific signal transduction histidine kinase
MNKHIQNPFKVSFIFFIFSVIFLSVFFNKIERDSLVEQIQHRQQVAVRSGAKSIESFLNAIGRTTAVLADDPTQLKLDEFVNMWKNDNVVGVIAVSKDGRVIAASNREEKTEIGQTVLERGYFNWAKTAKKSEYHVFTPVISKIGSSKGQYIVTIASPILRNGKFDGVVVSAILLSELTNTYLGNLKVLDTSNLYLITSDGIVVYSDQSDLAGLNFSEIFKDDFLGKDKIIEWIGQELSMPTETKAEVALPNYSNNLKLEPYLISGAPVALTNDLWKIVITLPEKDLFVFTYSIFGKQVLTIFVVVTLFIIVTLKASRNSGYQEAVIDEHKKHGIS